jgi:hypothetical protein
VIQDGSPGIYRGDIVKTNHVRKHDDPSSLELNSVFDMMDAMWPKDVPKGSLTRAELERMIKPVRLPNGKITTVMDFKGTSMAGGEEAFMKQSRNRQATQARIGGSLFRGV